MPPPSRSQLPPPHHYIRCRHLGHRHWRSGRSQHSDHGAGAAALCSDVSPSSSRADRDAPPAAIGAEVAGVWASRAGSMCGGVSPRTFSPRGTVQPPHRPPPRCPDAQLRAAAGTLHTKRGAARGALHRLCVLRMRQPRPPVCDYWLWPGPREARLCCRGRHQFFHACHHLFHACHHHQALSLTLPLGATAWVDTTAAKDRAGRKVEAARRLVNLLGAGSGRGKQSARSRRPSPPAAAIATFALPCLMRR